MRPPPYELIVTMATREPRSVAPIGTTTFRRRTLAVGRGLRPSRWVPALTTWLAAVRAQ
jgi:hypothetical protein